MLYRSDSADYRAQVLDMESAVGAGSDMTPPTPAFPISPPTPYGKHAEYKMRLLKPRQLLCYGQVKLSPRLFGVLQ